MKKLVQHLTVRESKRLNRDHHLLVLEPEIKISDIRPGQFVNILVDKSRSVFLRRPFSIFSVDYINNTISVLIKIVGDGTIILSKSVVGDMLSVVFPLGTGFSLPADNAKVLLVGGGCGVAPLLFLAQTLKQNNTDNIFILLGAASAEGVVEVDKYRQQGTVLITTEDGTAGERGYVTDHSVFKVDFDSFDMVYTCGPEPMMKAVVARASEAGLPCEVSLENSMACGFGVCLCCVADTVDGNKCVCTDGPVFNSNYLKWQT